MTERVNFVCVGTPPLPVRGHTAQMQTVLSRLNSLRCVAIEVMRLDTSTGSEAVLPWHLAESHTQAPLGVEELLVLYFAIEGTDSAARQSLTFEARDNWSVVTLSLDPSLVSDGSSAPSVLGDLTGWAAEVFEGAALACGPELDLYEVGNERDSQLIEQRLAADPRCWLSVSTHRFPKRMWSSRERPL